MAQPELSVVTGAFSYTGRYVAQRLLAQGHRVVTLTRRAPTTDPFGGRVEVAPLDFDDPDGLTRSMEGATTLYNTYWVRFSRGSVTFERAVENIRVLARAAKEAGVRKLVHWSITGASADSPFPYFRGKGLGEQAVKESGLPQAIVRPSFVFGPGDILVNNIAWFLRRFPLFPVFGSGDYRVQPVFVDDVAALAIEASRSETDAEWDAVGPETFMFEDVVRLIADATGSRARLVHMWPGLALAMTRMVGPFVGDVVLSRDEVDGLMAGLLTSSGAPTGETRFSGWLAENADSLGRRYTSEVRRNYR